MEMKLESQKNSSTSLYQLEQSFLKIIRLHFKGLEGNWEGMDIKISNCTKHAKSIMF